MNFVKSDESPSDLQRAYESEYKAWDQFYDALLAAKDDPDISQAAKRVFDGALL